MIEFNDSHADMYINGISIFSESIDVDDDILISSSCLFLGDIVTTGSIKSQYNLHVIGDIRADGVVTVGGSLICKSVQAQDISVDGKLTVEGMVQCEDLFVGEAASFGGLFSQKDATLNSTAFSTGVVDVSDNLIVEDAIVCTEYIEVGSSVKASTVVTNDLQAPIEEIEHKILIPLHNEFVVERTAPSSDATISIAESNPQDVFDANSILSLGIEDCASFLDQLNEQLINADPWDVDFENYLTAFGGYIPAYEELWQLLKNLKPYYHIPYITADTWVDRFDVVTKALTGIPQWFRASKTESVLIQMLQELLDFFLQKQSVSIHSKSQWMTIVGRLQSMKTLYEDNSDIVNSLDALSDQMFMTLGLKNKSVKASLYDK